jgi:hypothetical protein
MTLEDLFDERGYRVVGDSVHKEYKQSILNVINNESDPIKKRDMIDYARDQARNMPLHFCTNRGHCHYFVEFCREFKID